MERQQPQVIHPAVATSIVQTLQQRMRKLIINNIQNGVHQPVICNRVSVQAIVNFLQSDNDGQNVNDLWFTNFHLIASPADGGLNVLCPFFVNNTSLTEVKLRDCDFGGPLAGAQVLASFHNNQSITHLQISGGYCNMEEAVAVWGTSLSQLIDNSTTLVRLEASAARLNDTGFQLIVTSLVGNTTLRVLEVGAHGITHNSVTHISTLLQSTRLQEISLHGAHHIFNAQRLQSLRDELLNNRYLLTLRLGHNLRRSFPAEVAAIDALLGRNQATSLSTTVQPQSGIWPVAMAKWASRPVCANAIYSALQLQPILLDRPIPRPSQQQQQPPPQQQLQPPLQQQAQDDGDNDENENEDNGDDDDDPAAVEQEAEDPPLQVQRQVAVAAAAAAQEPERNNDPNNSENHDGDDSVGDEQPHAEGNVGIKRPRDHDHDDDGSATNDDKRRCF